MAKSYGKWGGLILLVLGVIGLFSRPQFIGLNTEWPETIIHLVAGAVLAYVGFRGADAQARTWAYVAGVVFLLIGLVGFVNKNFFGLAPQVGFSTFDNIVHLAYGVVGLWAGYSTKSS